MKRILLAVFSVLCIYPLLHSQTTPSSWNLSGNTNASASSKLGTNTYVPLRLLTNNLERMRISASGRVGIGTTTPSKKLDVVGGAVISNGLTVMKQLDEEPVINSNAITAVSYLYFNSTMGTGTGVYADGYNSGVFARSMGAGPNVRLGHGVDAVANAIGVASNGYYYGVYGHAEFNDGGDHVYEPGLGAGVRGFSALTIGGYFSSTDGIGVEAYSENNYAGYFNGDVYTTGVYQTSDEALKENVTMVSDAISKIKQLKPTLYAFKKDAKFKGLSLPEGFHYGLMAQDIEKVFPHLIRETTKLLAPLQPLVPDKEGRLIASTEKTSTEKVTIKAVNYTELIPILIRGMQEMDSTISQLQEEIAALKLAVDAAGRQNIPGAKAWMMQNVPNPVASNTTIKYFIPNETRSARILITDAKGQQLKIFNVSGDGAVQFSAGTLPSGTYTYSLIVDEKIISAKKMSIAR